MVYELGQHIGRVESLEAVPEKEWEADPQVSAREKLEDHLDRYEPTRAEWAAILAAAEALPAHSYGQNERGNNYASGGPADKLLDRLYDTTLREGDLTPRERRRSDRLIRIVGLIGRCNRKRQTIPSYKLCPACNRKRSKDAFYRDAYKRDGLQNTCKECMRERRAS